MSTDLARAAHEKIQPASVLVETHLEVLKQMVKIDSRSFSVNEFPGDRKTPSDMKEILHCAETYLRGIGFSYIRINQPVPGDAAVFPILLADLGVPGDKPTLLCYAHLDKQPYMDDASFQKWDGTPPTELRWNQDRTRAYGRGAADDLSGVIAIGMAVDALLKSLGFDARNPSPETLAQLPCNIKVIFETEEESGSHTLIEQIQQNSEFFAPVDGVIITDVVNPATGVPGLTTSLRGIIQVLASMRPKAPENRIDAQTALYKLVATLIHADHSLAVDGIRNADQAVTEPEHRGYQQVPTSIELLRDGAGILPATRLTVQAETAFLLEAQLRRSFANVRPGHRVAGSIIFGSGGARLTFKACKNAAALKSALTETLHTLNPFNLSIRLESVSTENPDEAVFDLIVQASTKDPHSGVHGGPFPVAELQVAKMVDSLIDGDGVLHPALAPFSGSPKQGPVLTLRSLHVENNGRIKLFDAPSAQAMVEIRLAPGNEETQALKALQEHLENHTAPGFTLDIAADKGASPWMTGIDHPAFSLVLEALERGYGTRSCLYGCGGSIPFVPKLMQALNGVPPMCLGAYDPPSRIHEPGESMSMADLLGCARSIAHFATQAPMAFPSPKSRQAAP